MLMDAKNVVSRENDRPRVRDTNGKLNTDLVLWFSIWQVGLKGYGIHAGFWDANHSLWLHVTREMVLNVGTKN